MTLHKTTANMFHACLHFTNVIGTGQIRGGLMGSSIEERPGDRWRLMALRFTISSLHDSTRPLSALTTPLHEPSLSIVTFVFLTVWVRRNRGRVVCFSHWQRLPCCIILLFIC